MMQQGDSSISSFRYQSHLQNYNPSFSYDNSSQASDAPASAPPLPSVEYSYDYANDLHGRDPSSISSIHHYYQNSIPMQSGQASSSFLPHDSATFGAYGGQGTTGGYSDCDFSGHVYAYDGGSGIGSCDASSTETHSSHRTIFDDYGRPISISSDNGDPGSRVSSGVVETSPISSALSDFNSGGLEKFHAKLLAEGGGHLDVLCQHIKQMNGGDEVLSITKAIDHSVEKQKGFNDWIGLIKSSSEEKEHWVPDEVATKCSACAAVFGAFVRKHHCRNCGDIFCDKCTQGRIALTVDEQSQPVRVCDCCMAEVTQRLCNSGGAARKIVESRSPDELTRKLQEEMDRNCKALSGSELIGWQTKELACPTCTVHLQVQLPMSGSKTIECSVCEHSILVNSQ